MVAYGWPYACPGLDTVVVDLEKAIYVSTSHLLEQGHTLVGYISDHRHNYVSVDKVDGYRRALKEFDLQEPVSYTHLDVYKRQPITTVIKMPMKPSAKVEGSRLLSSRVMGTMVL